MRFAKALVCLLWVCVAGLAAQTSEYGHSELNSLSNTDALIRDAQDHLRHGAPTSAGYERLGALYQQKGRETGDAAWFELAERALKQAVDLASDDFGRADPLVQLAAVYMSEHRFTDALADARDAIATGAGDADAFAIEGDALTDLGHYDDAARAYETLRSLTSESSPIRADYIADSRLSYLKMISGDMPGAIGLVEQSITAAAQLSVPPENRAWLYYELGERCFQSGNITCADAAYSAGLAIDPRHFRCLAGLARVRAAQWRLDESIRLYQRSIDVVPMPQYIAELGDVLRAAGQTDRARQEDDLVEYIGKLTEINRVLNNRELAMFYADRGIRLDEALRLARAEFDVRSDIYTWDALAWVLYKRGEYAEAKDAIEKALRLHTSDPMFFFHAGMISRALNENETATRYLSKALTINPHFHVAYAGEARQALSGLAAEENTHASR
jgi:tetratricopeptide (TPR) repeat protein